MKPTSSTWQTAIFLFFSGACALIYQTVWMRDFRLIFGVSTLATSAVLATFMGGLGLGSALLGRRADRHPRPLAFYGTLEMLIAASAAITPLLLMAVRWGYIAVGGSATLGDVLATILRLVFSALVLLIPTTLMGGTLPAAARAVESNDDAGRRRLALLYGVNTIGAVVGALVSTFVLLERFGNRSTLLIAAVINVAIGAIAFFTAKSRKAVEQPVAEESFRESLLPPKFALVAAALVGFAFLLMELVWYRMLSPILGGTTFMFGIVLAVALAGIGIGGAIYSFGGRERTASASGFALTCTLEALAMILPFAIGDPIAIFANALRRLEVFGFGGHVLAWIFVTTVVAFPAAIIAGYQFPLLISLVGRGRDSVGREVGLTYAWNTAGAIAASLLGGFILLPMLGATGTWKLAAIVLIVLGAATFIYSIREKRFVRLAVTGAAAVCAILATLAVGPSAVWRHSGIGAGRAPQFVAKNDIVDWERKQRRTTLFSADGRESSIALLADDDLALIVNGKSDGSAHADAGTQIMAGMLGALVHPAPKSALVVGLGTGTTAGWLASVPSMSRVDVVELEPVVVRIADYFAPVNKNAMDNPKVNVRTGDAREVLLTSRNRYDLIFSEPSNPYRAGIASLYTREFYDSAVQRLQPNGIFLQWVQSYGVDARTIQTIYATMTAVFPHVDTWTTTSGDVLLAASPQPIVYDIDLMRRRLAQHPYLDAAHAAWRVESVEGVLARFLASDAFATAAAGRAPELNTDDRQVIEFSFARTLGSDRFSVQTVATGAQTIKAMRPTHVRGQIDWNLVDAQRASIPYLKTDNVRNTFAREYQSKNYDRALQTWRSAEWQPTSSAEASMIAHVLANAGDERAVEYAQQVRRYEPGEADLITAILRVRQKQMPEAAALMNSGFTHAQTEPWISYGVMGAALENVISVAADPQLAAPVLGSLSKPFAGYYFDDPRRRVYVATAWQAGRCGQATLAALNEMEPDVPWIPSILQIRSTCYGAASLQDLAPVAQQDLIDFVAAEPNQAIVQ